MARIALVFTPESTTTCSANINITAKCHTNQAASRLYSAPNNRGEYQESINIILAVLVHAYQTQPIVFYMSTHEPSVFSS